MERPHPVQHSHDRSNTRASLLCSTIGEYMTCTNCKQKDCPCFVATERSTAVGGEGVDEDKRDAIDGVLNRLEDWGKAYPIDMFGPITDEEHAWLHNTRPGLMDRISASMGRHMAEKIAEDIATLRNITTPQSAPVDGETRPIYWMGEEVKTTARLIEIVKEQCSAAIDYVLADDTTPPPASQERGGDGWQVARDAIAIHQSFNTTADMADWLRDLLPPSSAAEDVPDFWVREDSLAAMAEDYVCGAAEQAKPDGDKSDGYLLQRGRVAADDMGGFTIGAPEQARAGE